VLEGEPLVDFDDELELELDAELDVVFAVELVDEEVGAAVVDAFPVEAVERLPVPPATWNVGE